MRITFIIFSTLILFLMTSCTPKGTLQEISSPDPNIEISKFYYEEGEFVFISRYKNEKKILTTTWKEQRGKTSVTRGNVIIFENDSIIIYQK